MTQNKKQHFVPKFYLRKFSSDGNSIGIYNIKSARLIPRGNLPNQCYRNYFYGKDLAIEDALAGMEGAAAHTVRHCIDREIAPLPGSAHHLVLCHFVVLQSARTAHEAKASAEETDKFFKTVFRDQFGSLEGYEIGFDDPVLMSLRISARTVPAIYDLKIKLLRNDSPIDFVTSDNPVARHNQYYEGNDHFGQTGLGQAGLQIFLPLSPKYLCLFYDSQTYKVGTPSESMVSIASEQDIHSLNALQWLNALENVYFLDDQHGALVAQAPRLARRRQEAMSSVSEHRVVKRGAKSDDSGLQRSLVHAFRTGMNVRLNLSCMSIRRRPKHPRFTDRAAPVRNEHHMRIIHEFAELLAQKKVSPEDFFKFAAQHPLASKVA